MNDVFAPVSDPLPASQLSGRKVLFVVAEFPTRGTAGFHSYNRDVVSALLAQGAEVHLQVLFPRVRKLRDALADLPNAESLHIAAPGLWRRGQAVHVIGPRALAGWGWRLFKPVVHRWLGRRTAQQRTVQIGRFAGAAQVRKVAEYLNRCQPDLVLLDTMFMSPLLPLFKAVPVVMVAHDVFHQRVANLQRNGLDPQPAVSADQERVQLNQAAAVVAISAADAQALLALGVTVPVRVFSPVVRPLGRPGTFDPAAPALFYMGSAAHHNLHAVRWFLAAVWPLMRARWPALTLRVAGDIGAALDDVPAGVLRLGRVDDPVRAASGCVAAIDPVQAGSGVKIKILSYMSLGLLCITTPAGAAGLDDLAAALLVADEPVDMVEALAQMLSGRLSPQRVAATLAGVIEARQRTDEENLAQLLLGLGHPMPPDFSAV